MSSNIAISVKNLTKTYRLFDHPGDRIKQALTFGRVKFHKEFTALKDVSFEVRKGETVGIIGKNGSGKSTLLQLICGILKPTSGSVTVNGRISALLELGSGFNPEFTGRENIYFQGAIMGLSEEEMDARVDDIIAFADIGEFIDQPVRTYSSGMFVRLAFATSIHVEPDILVIDEALAVGDIGFQQKCHQYFTDAKKKGMTLLLVSHDMLAIRALCNRAIHFKSGMMQMDDEPEIVSELYLKETLAVDSKIHKGQKKAWQTKQGIPHSPAEGRITGILLKADSNESYQYKTGDRLHLELSARVGFKVEQPQFTVHIKDKRGYVLFGMRTQLPELQQHTEDEWKLVSTSLSLSVNLGSGEYGVVVSLLGGTHCTGANMLDRVVDGVVFSVDSSSRNFQGAVDLDGFWNHPQRVSSDE